MVERLGDRVGAAMIELRKIIEAFRNFGLAAPAFIGSAALRRFNAWRTRRAIAKAPDAKTVFRLIYQNQWWDKGGESASGPGSTIEFTQSFRADFERYLRQQQVGTLFDAPCGDWNWMKEVQFPPAMQYIGGDVVSDLVEETSRRFGGRGRSFKTFDITKDRFPNADIWLCRDCLAHLSNVDVKQALDNFCDSQIPFALISNYIGVGPNEDIASGGFRPLDLTKHPFNLPDAYEAINDWPGQEGVRKVGLWRREAIAEALARMAETPKRQITRLNKSG